jgi:hypothetical protein
VKLTDVGTVNFHISEYNQLRSEFSYNVRFSYSTLVYVSISNAAIAAWIASGAYSSKVINLIPVVCWMPLLLTLLGWMLVTARNGAAVRTIAYLTVLEEKLSLEGLGWERFVKNYGRSFRTKHAFNIIFLVECLLCAGFGLRIMMAFANP